MTLLKYLQILADFTGNGKGKHPILILIILKLIKLSVWETDRTPLILYQLVFQGVDEAIQEAWMMFSATPTVPYLAP